MFLPGQQPLTFSASLVLLFPAYSPITLPSWYMLDQSKRIAPSSSSHRQVDPRFALSFIAETQTVSRGNSTPHTLGYLILPRLYIHKQQILKIPHTHNPHHVNKRLRLQTLQVGCFRVGALAVSPVTISTPTESTCHSL